MSMSLSLNSDQITFRDQLRAFLESHLPAEIKRGVRLNVASMHEPDVSRPWHAILHANGLAAPGWPVEFGGRGWSEVQQYLWRMECWRAGAPSISPFGMRLVAPALMEFGTAEQRERFLPGLLSGLDYWCQGFSEPQAGSDLAALRCQAVLDGDRYVLNGTKMWQTHAHHSNWMITLVRSGEGRPQDGVSCLLIDLTSPGVTIRPIETIGGDHEVNQIFLDDVIVPVTNRLGRDGQGWAIAKHLLGVERRSAGNAVGRLRANFASLLHLLSVRDDRWDLPGVSERVGEIAGDIDALEVIDLHQLLNGAGGKDASLMKLRASELEQSVAEVAVLALGHDALRWEAARPLDHLDQDENSLAELAVTPRYLNGRARTIYGGATEVQLDIISKDAIRA